MGMEHVIWKRRQLLVNGREWMTFETDSASEQAVLVYKALGLAYPKFYKMDILSKVAYLCSELLLKDKAPSAFDPARTAACISTADGCIEADTRFLESTETIPSPALFVYTLPNIMLGEICIRHKLKGEQVCYSAPLMDREDMRFYLQDIFTNRRQEHCLCGHVNVQDDLADAELYWVDKATYTSL
ncbi:MAG: hypothetical protein BGO09_10135 [Bacteroidetes bacterium 47-18]|nr:MAG: hypothetical protein BGO09_10135 [Bacteroidetes bacterium 47-18]